MASLQDRAWAAEESKLEGGGCRLSGIGILPVGDPLGGALVLPLWHQLLRPGDAERAWVELAIQRSQAPFQKRGCDCSTAGRGPCARGCRRRSTDRPSAAGAPAECSAPVPPMPTPPSAHGSLPRSAPGSAAAPARSTSSTPSTLPQPRCHGEEAPGRVGTAPSCCSVPCMSQLPQLSVIRSSRARSMTIPVQLNFRPAGDDTLERPGVGAAAIGSI